MKLDKIKKTKSYVATVIARDLNTMLDNEDNFSEDLKDKLWQAFYEYPTQEMFDSRMKSDTITMEAGKIDEEYTKYNGFNAKYNNDFS